MYDLGQAVSQLIHQKPKQKKKINYTSPKLETYITINNIIKKIKNIIHGMGKIFYNYVYDMVFVFSTQNRGNLKSKLIKNGQNIQM